MAKKTMQQKKPIPQKVWLAIVLAIITLVGTIVTALGPKLLEQLQPTSSNAQSENFDYQVHIETSAGIPIPSATVTIEIGGGRAPLDTISDSKGLARILIDTSYIGKPGRLIIRAIGYKPFIQNIDLTEGDLPKIIQLEPTP